MFKKKERTRKDHSGKSLAQYGLFDMPADFDTGLGNADNDDNEGDSDLEAELAALADGNGPTRPMRRKNRKIVPQGQLDAMVTDSMKDVGSDDDVSVDENDPELLGELNELTSGYGEEETPSPTEALTGGESSDTATVLTERLKNYEKAESLAKEAGESSKARRYARAIKTLKNLVSQAQKGIAINLNDESVPPDIHLGEKKPPAVGQEDSVTRPSRPAPSIPSEASITPPSDPVLLPPVVQDNVEKEKQNIDEELLTMLSERQKEYKIAALRAKKGGDAQTAVKYVKLAKQFDGVIEAVKNGQPVDLSKMPGPPGDPVPEESPKEESENQKATVPELVVPEEAADLPEPMLVTASSVQEALEQHLTVYKQHEAQAKEQDNSSKARRYGRIIKQFEDALKKHKAGRPFPVDELPIPPGYAPIPVNGAEASAAPKPAPVPKPAPDLRPAPRDTPSATEQSEGPDKKSSPSSRISGNHMSTSHADKQVLILLAKQKQFKQAALNAKKKGELNEAKEFLRQAKGFDRLIEAAQGGLPVDWASIPVSPEAKSQLDNEYEIVLSDEFSGNSDELDVIARLENQLQKQLKMCLTTRDHNKALGDVAGANRFERLGLNVAKDLDVVRMARKNGTVPKFRYEMKDFSIVKCFTDISDNSMEVTIHRGINYQSDNPKDIDTYVKLDFPFPQETPYSDRTSTIKNTNNPEYNKTFVIPIQRNSRQCQRVFKRHSVKMEVYSKGGLFRSDSMIGTVNVKLQPLETQCEIHDSFDLMEGRKKLGGKLEVQVKLRTPIVTQQVEQVQEKWLILNQ